MPPNTTSTLQHSEKKTSGTSQAALWCATIGLQCVPYGYLAPSPCTPDDAKGFHEVMNLLPLPSRSTWHLIAVFDGKDEPWLQSVFY